MTSGWKSTNDFYNQVKTDLRAECNVILADKKQVIPLSAKVSIVRGALDKYATIKFFDDGNKGYKIQCYMAYNAIQQTQILVPSIMKEMKKLSIYDPYSLCDDITEYYRGVDISEGLQAYRKDMTAEGPGTQGKSAVKVIVDCIYAEPKKVLRYPYKVDSKGEIGGITQLQSRYLEGMYQSKADAKAVYSLLADGTHSIRPISKYGYDLVTLADMLRTVSQKILTDIA